MDDRLNYIEILVAILDRGMKNLKNRAVDIVKVQWQHQRGSECTWEPEDKMRQHYHELFEVADFKYEV